jgi:phosphomevalonate kinase
VTPVLSSAPGKIVLSGEYAVLAGAPAIVAAIDRRAAVEVRNMPGEGFLLRTLGDRQREFPFRFDATGSVEWPGGEPVMLLDSVIRVVGPLPRAGLQISLDTRAFFDPASATKYGFGSSAALTVALTLALCHIRDGTNQFASEAAAAHKLLQGGRGSGVDVAASVQGGLLEFRNANDNSCRRLTWPEGLQWVAVWSGRAASTTNRLDKLGKIDAEETSCAELLERARDSAQAWAGGDVNLVLDRMHQFANALQRFSDTFDLGIYEGGHDELRRLAKDVDVLFKPCGAGGGDVGVALSADASALASFAGAVQDAGYQVIDVSLETRGASRNGGNEDG